MERKVRTEEQTHSEGGKVKSSGAFISLRHKIFSSDTRELQQKTKLQKYFSDLDLTLKATRNFKSKVTVCASKTNFQ